MVWRSQQALLSPAPQAALYIRCLSFHRHLPSLRFRRPAQCIQGRRRPRSPRSCVLAGCEHTGQADDGGIIIAKGARALFRMTGRMTGRTILNDWGLASHCMHAGSPRLHGGACWPSKVRQGGLHEEAAHHKAGESNRTCAHRVQLPKQNPGQAHKRAQQRRGWRAVDRRAGGCAQNSVHVCSLVTRHRGRA